MVAPTIEVIVVGGANSGKTTVAQIIGKALKDAGIMASVSDPFDTGRPVPSLEMRLERLKERLLTVQVVVAQRRELF